MLQICILLNCQFCLFLPKNIHINELYTKNTSWEYYVKIFPRLSLSDSRLSDIRGIHINDGLLIDDDPIFIHKEAIQPEALKVDECFLFILSGRAAGSVDSLPFQIVAIILNDDIRILIFTVADSMKLTHFIPGLVFISSIPEIASHIAFMKVFSFLNVLNSTIHPSMQYLRQNNQGCNATLLSLSDSRLSDIRGIHINDGLLIDDDSIFIHKEAIQPEALKMDECFLFMLSGTGRAPGSVDSFPFQIVAIILNDDIRILFASDSMMLIHYKPELIIISRIPEIAYHIEFMKVFSFLNVLNSTIHPSMQYLRENNQGCNSTLLSLSDSRLSDIRDIYINDGLLIDGISVKRFKTNSKEK